MRKVEAFASHRSNKFNVGIIINKALRFCIPCFWYISILNDGRTNAKDKATAAAATTRTTTAKSNRRWNYSTVVPSTLELSASVHKKYVKNNSEYKTAKENPFVQWNNSWWDLKHSFGYSKFFVQFPSDIVFFFSEKLIVWHICFGVWNFWLSSIKMEFFLLDNFVSTFWNTV